jgi:carbon monoxide dehydrogenase subunit G
VAIELKGAYTFDIPAARVWELLIDPAVVAQCLPGCDELRPLGDDRYEAVLSLTVASIGGTYRATIAIVDKVPPHSYRLLVEGKGPQGFVNGQSRVTLVEQEGRTTVEVIGDAQIGGMVARVGQRLLAGVGKMLMDRFYACLQQRAAGG